MTEPKRGRTIGTSVGISVASVIAVLTFAVDNIILPKAREVARAEIREADHVTRAELEGMRALQDRGFDEVRRRLDEVTARLVGIEALLIKRAAEPK